MRAVIVLDVWKVQTACGFAVPYLALKADPEDKSNKIPYLEDRQTLGHWGGKQVSAGTLQEQRSRWNSRWNSRLLDGLPGLLVTRRDAGERVWLRDVEAQIRKRNGLQVAFIAFFSALATVVALYMLGLTTLPAPKYLVR